MLTLIEFLTYLNCGFIGLFVYAFIRGIMNLIKRKK